MISKLSHYGIRGTSLNWFKSYLNNRRQHTEINGILSDIDTIRCGVPQGSVLGPLLFLLYINDIIKTSEVLKFFLFADDTKIYFSTKDNQHTEKILNSELQKVTNWLHANKLSLNVGKSCYLKFSLLHNQTDIKLKMAKEPLKREKVTKYLGVLIDDKLSWKHHIQSINTKLRKGIGILSNIKEYVTKGTLRTLYYSFIQPHLDYNILNWSSTHISNYQCLNTSTKKAVRILLSKNKREHALPLFKELKILPLDDHIKLRKGLYMWKIHNHLIPPHLSNKFQSHNTVIMERLHYGRYRLPNPR